MAGAGGELSPAPAASHQNSSTGYRIHLKGLFFLTQTFLPLTADGGRIVNISSGLTRIIYPGRIAYGSMKGAVEVMTRYMAKELGPLAFIRDLENGARG
jgi:NAD(P)-dependent dehydrogenase (short-subunit alcohol dehydrogenase family)